MSSRVAIRVGPLLLGNEARPGGGVLAQLPRARITTDIYVLEGERHVICRRFYLRQRGERPVRRQRAHDPVDSVLTAREELVPGPEAPRREAALDGDAV